MGNRSRSKAFHMCLLLGLLMTVIMVKPAFAHKVFVYAWVEGDRVYTESYFSAGNKVKNGLVQVFDSKGKKLLEGHTNEKGEFSFRPPVKDDLRIVLIATMGHRGEFLLKADELGIESSAKDTVPKKETKEATKETSTDTAEADVKQIKKIFEEVLDTRLQPIAHAIAKLREEKGPGITEIVGGIGYIFGLMGILLFALDRRKK